MGVFNLLKNQMMINIGNELCCLLSRLEDSEIHASIIIGVKRCYKRLKTHLGMQLGMQLRYKTIESM